ncbi:hypothetical protein MHYP_G00249980 [Metynnis hypsauchen]
MEFLLSLSAKVSECDTDTKQSFIQLLTSMCSERVFPFNGIDEEYNFYDVHCDFLLDLYSHGKDYETQTGRTVLPALQPVYQSAPAVWIIDLSERKNSLFLEVLKLQTVKKPVQLWGWPDKESEVSSFLQCLPYISQLRFRFFPPENKKSAFQFLLSLSAAAAESDSATGESFTELLTSVCSYSTFPYDEQDKEYNTDSQCEFLLDLVSHVKNYETQTDKTLQPVYQSAPAVWIIDLSQIKSSLFLEVLKLQTMKKPVELTVWSDEESEVRSFLQCLPYISQLRLDFGSDIRKNTKIFLDLMMKSGECEIQTGEKTLELLTSVCTYSSFPYRETHRSEQSEFLLDLFSHVKNYETQTGKTVLPALQPVYQSAPAVWIIDLSERKSSLFLEVLNLQTVKKPVKLRGWTDEEGEVRSFLRCLPYISQLRFVRGSDIKKTIQMFMDMLTKAADCEIQTGEKTLQLLSSVCTYSSFPFGDACRSEQSEFLLDLFSHVKNYETQTGRTVLPALLPVYQSAPAVWIIDLSERKSSLFLEVLKLQTVKKPVKLRGWSDEESEVRSFLRCLPYISQLRFVWGSDIKNTIQMFMDMLTKAADCEIQTGEKTLQLLSSVCTYSSFPFGDSCRSEQSEFLLDLFSHVKNYEIQAGRAVLPALQPVYQSAPAVWIINLSERKSSLFLEVLKLQPEKKPVKLTGWSYEESEVRSFLQCLPYISQLRFCCSVSHEKQKKKSAFQFLLNLIVAAAAESDSATGQRFTELLTSVCSYSTFPYDEDDEEFNTESQCEFLLDLVSHVKNYETQTGRNVLPALQPVYQSAPAIWIINLSERKSSLFLEVLKLQTVKKPVELRGWSDEESEVRSFLQCLPYISQLSYSAFPFHKVNPVSQWNFLLDLVSHVKTYETQTGRNVLPALQPVYQSAPAVWIIDLSERKSSLFLEVLKLQTEKKPVKLTGWTDEESEVRSFLQCLPYISQLRFSEDPEDNKPAMEFLLSLSAKVSECDTDTKQSFIQLLTSMCSERVFPFNETDEEYNFYDVHCEFLLDLYSHVKDYETQTGRNVLPALQPVYQSAPAVWIIDLSERKSSLFLEVLKLQTVKKPVELRDWSDEESEVRSFLQCLPYISQLRFPFFPPENKQQSVFQFLLSLSAAAAESDSATGESFTELLTSVCSYSTFPYNKHDEEYNTDSQCEFLLDLFSHVKNYETQTGRTVLPALQPFYQSAPAVWIIDLSERKSSLFLEVLKLQTVKKPVELTGWSDEESEVRRFLQCLPYISQLRLNFGSDIRKNTKIFLDLMMKLGECEIQTGEKTLELLTSVCTYSSFPYRDIHRSEQSEFLLDLFSHVKNYETQTGKTVLPALQPVYQSAPAVWIIDLSERKSSLFLEVLNLQTVKKPVKLRNWSDEESEVKSFLQCLPYISQLR